MILPARELTARYARSMRTRLRAFTLSIGLSVFAATAHGAPVLDPTGDFLPTYVGPSFGDVDIVSAEVLLSEDH
jgi:hypothetical protein